MPKFNCNIHSTQFGILACPHLIKNIYNGTEKIEFKKVCEDEWDEYHLCLDCYEKTKNSKEEILNELQVVCLKCAKGKITDY